jgi:undecaprenyl-diphosphatase
MAHAHDSATQPTRAALVLALGLAFALGAAVLFIWLAGVVWRGQADHLDDRVLHWFVAHRTAWWTGFFVSVTALGSKTIILILGIGLCAALLLARRTGMAAALVASVLGGTILSTALKMVFQRPRPPLAVRLTENVSYAFPSGHTISAYAFFVTIALLAASHVPGRPLRIFLVTYALGVGALVAISRLYVGAHYLSDVVGGALLGTAWAVSVVIAEHVWRHRWRPAHLPPARSVPT